MLPMSPTVQGVSGVRTAPGGGWNRCPWAMGKHRPGVLGPGGAEQAKETGLLVLSSIRAALAQRLGRPVSASVVGRLLARHGWRKVTPDRRHPPHRKRTIYLLLPRTVLFVANTIRSTGHRRCRRSLEAPLVVRVQARL